MDADGQAAATELVDAGVATPEQLAASPLLAEKAAVTIEQLGELRSFLASK
eukprot:SAG22_NODE_11813_length_468_cov_0.869919_1_plen_50_part_01